jgi:hypothetical protein
MQDTLVFLCHSAEEAIVAATKFPRRETLSRFFVFLGCIPAKSFTERLPKTDAYLTLKEEFDSPEQADAMGVRAGIIYANGWNVFFINPTDPPTDEDLVKCVNETRQNQNCFLDTVWGVSKEYVVAHSVAAFGGATPKNDNEPTKEPDFTEVAMAFQGLPCGYDAVSYAVSEVVEMHRASCVANTFDKDQQFAQMLIKRAHKIDNENPVTVIIGPKGTPEDFKHAQSKIPYNGSVIVLTKDPEPFLSEAKPYNTFFTKDGNTVLIFGKIG